MFYPIAMGVHAAMQFITIEFPLSRQSVRCRKRLGNAAEGYNLMTYREEIGHSLIQRRSIVTEDLPLDNPIKRLTLIVRHVCLSGANRPILPTTSRYRY